MDRVKWSGFQQSRVDELNKVFKKQVQQIETSMRPRPRPEQQLAMPLRRPPIQHMPAMSGRSGGHYSGHGR
jgi:hypothetical protein